MNESQKVFRVGNRDSNLAVRQTAAALAELSADFPLIQWEQINMSSPGDRDRKMDLRVSPGDFFSKDLDEAVIRGDLDCAVHSAKDLEYPLREELDWFWLPWKAAREDVLICREGMTPEELDKNSLIGVSSERREAYCAREFPQVPTAPIRGNIEMRLDQLDQGRYDMLIMAKAALDRLDLSHRITRIIPLEKLPAPEAQGILALSFRKGDERFTAIRSLYIKAVRFVGSGPGSASLCTLKGIEALKNCDICLYDSLLDQELLSHVRGEAVYTGKRSGQHSFKQQKITEMVSEYARKGLKVVRLKGGDPGIFGRLAEEAEELESLKIPFLVIPGVSSLNAATSATGLLLTRRGVSRGYTAISSRIEGGEIADTGASERARLPVIFFMSLKASGSVVRNLLDEGRPGTEPAAVVYNAGSPDQTIIRGTLGDIAGKIDARGYESPGLLITGEVARYGFDTSSGPLGGKRILLTCSERLMEKAALTVEDFGGIPLKQSLIRLDRSLPSLDLNDTDWIVLTSPGAIRHFMDLLRETRQDIRKLPKIMVCGTPSARTLEEYGLYADFTAPSPFGAGSLIQSGVPVIREGERVIRFRSDRAGSEITRALESRGALVRDIILYTNTTLKTSDACPPCDAVIFASSSAVTAFLENWGLEALNGKTPVAIGIPTETALKEKGVSPVLVSREASLPSSIETLSGRWLNNKLKEIL